MSFDLYEHETLDRIGTLKPITVPEVGAFDGFVRGAALATMQGFAKTARSIDMLGAVGPIAKDAFTGGTVLQDKYFKEHDEVWGSAVDYWTPKPNEVGVAGQIVGSLASMLPQVIASPALAIGSTQIGSAEDLVAKGVEATKAEAVGAVNAATLGLGIWMPILGQNLWQRMVVGGAGFNLVQGVAGRGAGQVILQGTPAADELKAFDGQSMTLDVLLGAAFGSIAHLSPAQRKQGGEVWTRIRDWAEALPPSDKAAIGALRVAQHLNVDSAPGLPATTRDLEAHVQRVRTAIEQLERGQPVEVSDLAEPKFEQDKQRVAENVRNADELARQAERVRKDENLPEPPAEPDTGRTPATATEAPAGQPRGAEPPPPRGPSEGKPAGAEAIDPIALEAERIVAEQPERPIRTGTNADGTPIVKTAREFLDEATGAARQAREDATLFEAAAQCLLGGGG